MAFGVIGHEDVLELEVVVASFQRFMQISDCATNLTKDLLDEGLIDDASAILDPIGHGHGASFDENATNEISCVIWYGGLFWVFDYHLGSLMVEVHEVESAETLDNILVVGAH